MKFSINLRMKKDKHLHSYHRMPLICCFLALIYPDPKKKKKSIVTSNYYTTIFKNYNFLKSGFKKTQILQLLLMMNSIIPTKTNDSDSSL